MMDRYYSKSQYYKYGMEPFFELKIAMTDKSIATNLK
jgi:hypothetical protein